MMSSIEITSLNYQEEVVVKSASKTVVVDFFATWCGPCQIVKPLLEKLASEYDFILAKIDIDREPELAAKFGVEGVPDIRIVRDGVMSAGFVGALAEERIRELLASFQLKSTLETEIEALRNAKNSGDLATAKQIIDRLFSTYPDRPEITIEAAKFLMTVDRIDLAEKMLATISPEESIFSRQVQSITTIIGWQKQLTEIENTGNDELDAIYDRAVRATVKEDYKIALTAFLDIVSTSRKYRDDAGRKAMLTIFSLLGDRDPLTLEYQQKLLKVLF